MDITAPVTGDFRGERDAFRTSAAGLGTAAIGSAG